MLAQFDPKDGPVTEPDIEEPKEDTTFDPDSEEDDDEFEDDDDDDIEDVEESPDKAS